MSGIHPARYLMNRSIPLYQGLRRQCSFCCEVFLENQSIPLYQGLRLPVLVNKGSLTENQSIPLYQGLRRFPCGEWRLSLGDKGGGKWRLRFVGSNSRRNLTDTVTPFPKGISLEASPDQICFCIEKRYTFAKKLRK